MQMSMKKIFTYITVLCAIVAALASCSPEKLSPESVIIVSQTPKTQFDKWLDENYLEPYNISFKYRYEINETDMNFYTVPPREREAIIMAHLVKHLCVETYNEVAGIDFTKGYFPKMFFLIGTWEYLNNGTFILGTAEGGMKIMLSGINELSEHLLTAEDLNHYYIKTIHHEFTHILNQKVTYQTAFKLVTANGYCADNWSTSPYNREYLANGFITDYAQHSDGEDFAEMMSEYITHDAAWWAGRLAQADEDYVTYKKKGTKPSSLISTKLDLVRAYMKETWNMDLDVLRATVLRRQQEVFDGKVDLVDISTKEEI